MLKLIICLASATLLAAVVLQLRQQRLQLSYESAELNDQIQGQQSKLWSQQVLIASCTAPNAINQTINLKDLKLVPESDPISLASEEWTVPPSRAAEPTAALLGDDAPTASGGRATRPPFPLSRYSGGG